MMARFLAWDHRWTQRLSIAETPGALRSAAAFMAHSGDSWFWLIGLALVYFIGAAGWQPIAMRFGIAIVVAAAVVLGLKLLFRRQRPEGNWGAIYRMTDPHSFPSGHAARAAMLATLSVGWGPPWLAVILLVWAPLVVLARVSMGVHFLVDVIAGAGLGLVAGLLFLFFFPV
jgi:undecaprenyl-diphosphatase